METNKIFSYWVAHAKEKEALRKMSPQERKIAFGEKLNFGTAGVRAKMGLGPSLLNEYTIAGISEAVAKTLPARKIAISFDTRQNSQKFAKITASIFAEHGIKVIWADSMPTPFLSFLVRFYRCDAGVMITASHNSKEYNGYKVYDSTGCQILPDVANNIAEKINLETCVDIRYPPFSEMEKIGLIEPYGQDSVECFYSEIEKVSKSKIQDISVIYSCLNGTGINLIPPLLEKHNVRVIPNLVQCAPDPQFTTCPKPNPELEEVFTYSRVLGKKNGADLILCTDPDGDRLGVEVLHKGEYVHLTGNEVGVLLAYYLAQFYKSGYIMRSIVSTPLVDLIASKAGITSKVCLTGFKYIGEFLNTLEKEKKADKFLLGFEESCGYLSGNYARDKDATVASLLICECASACKENGETLVDKLEEIYLEFGHFTHQVVSIKLKPDQSASEIMKNLRSNLSKFTQISNVVDYINGTDDLPPTDMLEFTISNTTIFLRPSGTEPIIKAYLTKVNDEGYTFQTVANTLRFILTNL